MSGTDDDGPKLEANTQVKLSPEMSAQLDAIKDREGCSKHAAIRRVMMYGLKVDEELQKLVDAAVGKVVLREKPSPVPLKTVPHSHGAKRGHHR